MQSINCGTDILVAVMVSDSVRSRRFLTYCITCNLPSKVRDEIEVDEKVRSGKSDDLIHVQPHLLTFSITFPTLEYHTSYDFAQSLEYRNIIYIYDEEDLYLLGWMDSKL